ncbi:hypothetical protein DRN32_02610, partial [Thermococci archaeon]
MSGKLPGKIEGVVSVCLFVFMLILIPLSSPKAADPTDIAQYVSITTANERTTLDRINRNLISTADVSITNTSATLIHFPIRIVIDVLDTDYSNVQMPGALGGPGTEPYGKYYFEIGAATVQEVSTDFGRTGCTANCPGDLDRDGDVDGYDLALVASGDSLAPGKKVTFHLTFVRDADISFRYNVLPYGVLEAGPVNHPPVVNAGGPYSATQGQEVVFDGSGCSDPDGDFIYYFWEFGDGQSSTEQNPIHIYQDPGQYTVVLTIKDSKGASATAQTLVSISRMNHAPVFSPIGPQEINEGSQLSFEVNAHDEDGDPLVYSVTNVPTGAYFDSPSHTFRWTPGFDQAGEYLIAFTATDQDGYSDAINIKITVNNVNRAPSLSPISDQSVDEGTQLTIQLSAEDPDNAPISYSAQNVPSGASIDTQTGLFSWTPGFDQSGQYAITLVASDGELLDAHTVSIT